MKDLLVSIIVPTYNSEKTIGRCLESIKNQTYENFEIIIVDRLSKDRTTEIAKEYGARIFLLDAERTAAKNFGVLKSRGKYVLFIDSDMELNKRVVGECVAFAERDPQIGGIIIPERSVGDSLWTKVRNFERSFYESTEIESARFFRKDLLDKVGGFDNKVVFFEESTLPQRIEKLEYSVKTRISAEILHHEEEFSLSRWLEKKYYYGKTARRYKQKYKDYGKKQISLLFRLGLYLKNKRFYTSPPLAIGVLTLKFLEYFSSGLGYFVEIIKE